MRAVHYGRDSLVADLEAALAQQFPPGHRLTPVDLAGLDQFHTRGLAATADLAELAQITSDDVVLDLGSGLGGPARYLAATYGCTVVGIDATASYVEAATMLTERSGLADDVSFRVGDALDTHVRSKSIDVVLMQHVAMNIMDRDALYREVRRVIRDGGRFVTYDVIRITDPIVYPLPWSSTAEHSRLLTEAETRSALGAAGFTPLVWRNDTELAKVAFSRPESLPPPTGLTLRLVVGPDFGSAVANMNRNLEAGSLGVLSAIVTTV